MRRRFCSTRRPAPGSRPLPLQILAEGNIAGRIILLEPRRLAARNVAQRLAELLGEKPGRPWVSACAPKPASDRRPAWRWLREGILTRMIQRDPELTGVGLVILDEFHERSLQADLARPAAGRPAGVT